MRDLGIMQHKLPTAPASYQLGIGEVHVWKVRLASRDEDVREKWRVLSAAEQERAARFVFEQDRARWIACRATLRMALSRYAGVAAERIVFRYEPGGKPALTGTGGWQFNVSHSRDVAAIAVCRLDAVGIDVEKIDGDFPRGEVAPDILAQDEIRELNALPLADQAKCFFQLWTMKEALVKAVGAGLSIEPLAIRVRMDAELGPAIVSAPPELLGAGVHEVLLEDGYACALAVFCREAHVSCFEWIF